MEYKESVLAKERSEKIRKMLRKRNITIRWGQVATRLPSLSGIKMRPPAKLKGSFQRHRNCPSGEEIGILGMGERLTRKQGR